MDATGNVESASSTRSRPARSVDQPHRSSTDVATVLVVDDEESVRVSTAAILRSDGFNILEAADGAAANWLLASEHVDVVLLDLNLGRLDGLAVLESLEETSTVVIFSGFSGFEETELRKRFGAIVFDCLRKPVPPPLLIEVIERAARHARSEDRETVVRPIAPRMALRLAMTGLAHLTPQANQGQAELSEGPGG